MVTVTKRYDDNSPDEGAIRAALEKDGLSVDAWSAEASTVNGPEALGYDRTIVVISGMARITLPDSPEEYADLMGGDRIDIPAGTKHGLMAGPAGASGVEGK